MTYEITLLGAYLPTPICLVDAETALDALTSVRGEHDCVSATDSGGELTATLRAADGVETTYRVVPVDESHPAEWQDVSPDWRGDPSEWPDDEADRPWRKWQP